MEYDGDMTINKKICLDDSIAHKDIEEVGAASERESAFCGKYIYGDQMEFMNSMNKLQGASRTESESLNEFAVEEEVGEEALAPNPIVQEDNYVDHGDGS